MSGVTIWYRYKMVGRSGYNGFMNDQEANILYHTSKQWRTSFGLIISIAMYRGWRISEIVKLRIYDFMDANFTTVKNTVCKTKITANFKIPKPLQQDIAQYVKANQHRMVDGYFFPGKNTGHINKATAIDAFANYRKVVGRKHPFLLEKESNGKHRVTFHTCRRWFITKLKEAGYNDHEVADIVRLKETKTIRTYWNGFQVWENEQNILNDTFCEFYESLNKLSPDQTTLIGGWN